MRVIERLNAAHAGAARFEPVLWEEKFYSAHVGFQEQIARPAECDIVVAVLRWRLGTPLSPEFAQSLPDPERALPVEAFESGTAYEILSAVAARRSGAPLPDIYVFRESGSPTPALDAPDRAEIERQWARLKAFAEKVFVTAEGHFKGAYDTYASLDEFETRVEKALRQWLEDKALRGGEALVWPIAIKGSPFRGLSAFGAKHEEVFFGRDGDGARALDRLKDGAEAGFPFLLIVGPSGAGKTSFARAGIVPKLAKPGVVSDVAAFRVAVMRPLEDPGGPVAALARRLFDAEADIPADEVGRPIALPELGEGDSATPMALADIFSLSMRGAEDEAADRAVVAPIARALKAVAAAERQKWHTAEEKPARLLLVIDQLDELFAPGVDEAARASFARLIGALARSGQVWVVATLRAELYEAFLQSPLAPFASGGDRLFNLLPPGLCEMAEVVRGPARAAGLGWERDAASGERLDEKLIAAIDRPDLLPLVQFALDRLYEQRETIDGKPTLTLKAWRALGALDGAIDTAAEEKFASLGAAEQAALPRLLRTLVAAGPSGALTLRPAPLASAAHDDAARRLIAALVEARVLVSSEDAGHAPMVALAHHRVVEAWGRARDIAETSRALMRVRDEVSAACERWEAKGRRADLLIQPGLLLSEAEDAAAKLGDELPQGTRDFVAASSKAARRRQRILAGAAAAFALLAVGAGGSAFLAYRRGVEAAAQRDRAEKSLALATQTADGLVFDLAQKFKDMAGMSAELRADILGRARTLQQQLSIRDGDNVALKRSTAASLMETVDSLFVTGDTAGALQAGRESVEIMESLVASDPDNVAWERDLSISHNKIGDVFVARNDLAQALDQYRSGLQIIEKYATANPGLTGLQRDKMVSYGKIGNVLVQQGQFAKALDYYKKDMETLKKLLSIEPANAELRRDFSISSNKIGDSLYYLRDYAAALASYREGFQNISALSASQPQNRQWLRDVAISEERIGDALFALDDLPGAMKVFRNAKSIREALSSEDPGNVAWQQDLSVIHEKVGDVATAQHDLPGALEAYRQSLQIRERLTALDRNNAEWRRNLMVSYTKLALTEPAKAREHLVKAKEIADELIAAGKLAPNDAGIPKIIDDALKALDAPAKPAAPPAPRRKR